MPSAEQKIAFDKFHVAQHLGDAIDKVRRREHKRLKAEADEPLAGTRYLWLKHPNNVSDRDWRGRFQALRESTLQTARARRIRERFGDWESDTVEGVKGKGESRRTSNARAGTR